MIIQVRRFYGEKMNRYNFAVGVGLPVFLLIFGIGCGGEKRPDDMPALRPVKILVTQEGKPLRDAVVMIIPEEKGSKWLASGVTDECGGVTPRTLARYPGVPEGKYMVTVSKKYIVPGEFEGPLPNIAEQKRLQTLRGMNIKHDVYCLVESQYADTITTPLTLEVDRGGANETFDVGKAVYEKKK